MEREKLNNVTQNEENDPCVDITTIKIKMNDQASKYQRSESTPADPSIVTSSLQHLNGSQDDVKNRPKSLLDHGRAGDLDFLSQSLDRDIIQRRRSATVAVVKEQATNRLYEELQRAQEELKLKDEEVDKLSRLRNEIEQEVEELTASLFEEAHSMVHEANVKREAAEKLLAEANGKIDVLSAEVSALKALVITSTPSTPNKHMHPQLAGTDRHKNGGGGANTLTTNTATNIFKAGHKRSPSHNDIKRSNSLKGWWGDQQQDTVSPASPPPLVEQPIESIIEVDPVLYREFSEWKDEASPSLDVTSSTFLTHVYDEDINPCLSFTNQQLATEVMKCIEDNRLTIEPIHGNNTFPSPTDDSIFIRRCSLTDAVTVCKYRMQLMPALADPPTATPTLTWHYICKLARDRVASVCDFYTYVRYITLGLVKNESGEVFVEVIRLRRQMALARLGVLNLP